MRVYGVPPPEPSPPAKVVIEMIPSEAAELMNYLRVTGVNPPDKLESAARVAARLHEQLQGVLHGVRR